MGRMVWYCIVAVGEIQNCYTKNPYEGIIVCKKDEISSDEEGFNKEW